MRRLVWLAVLVVSLATFTLIAPAGLAQQRQVLGHHVRFDLVSVVQGVVLTGGEDVGRDTATGDTVRLTGSGGFKPATNDAAGGGTFVHQHPNGTEVAHGVWVVTGFVSWEPAGGFLPPSLTDGIGEVSEASAGVVTIHVELRPSSGGPLPATLSVHCALPGAAFPIEEGITLNVASFVFEQHGGQTLFHILQ
ncbi:MAG TPA: hypothetical protein VFV60_06800 [bacterium]|nr:hypothetical protein [bacterium]